MNFFKLLLIFVLLLFETFAQRFLRHSINDVALIDGKDSDDNLLSSDGLNAEQVDGDVKLTGYIKEIELELDELKFEFFSKRNLHYQQVCMRQKVSVCYDAETPPLALQGECGPNQCRFEAGILGGDGENLLWLMIGVILFILLIGIIAAGVWYFCIRKQKKTSEKKTINAEPPKQTVEADIVKDKSEDKKEPAKPKMTKEDTNEKKKAVEKEKVSKPKKKEMKEQRIQLNPSKEITQENVTKEVPPKKVKAPVEPTLDDSTADASTVQEQQPQVFVPKTVIHPAPLQPASKSISQRSKSSSRKGSLSGRHEIGIMAESPSESVKRALDTESGMEEESTQVSITRASEKHLKKQSGEKK